MLNHFKILCKQYAQLLNKRVISSAISLFVESCETTIFAFYIKEITIAFLPVDTSSLWFSWQFIYALAYIPRPIGSWLFGRWAKSLGHTNALNVSLTLMAICSLVVYTLPTYQDIGIYATYILMCTRIIQGFSLAGEFPLGIINNIVYGSQESPHMINAFLYASGTLGILLVNFLSITQFKEWRLIFLFGVFLATIGIIIRTYYLKDDFIAEDLITINVTTENDIQSTNPQAKPFLVALFLSTHFSLCNLWWRESFFMYDPYQGRLLTLFANVLVVMFGLIFAYWMDRKDLNVSNLIYQYGWYTTIPLVIGQMIMSMYNYHLVAIIFYVLSKCWIAPFAVHYATMHLTNYNKTSAIFPWGSGAVIGASVPILLGLLIQIF